MLNVLMHIRTTSIFVAVYRFHLNNEQMQREMQIIASTPLLYSKHSPKNTEFQRNKNSIFKPVVSIETSGFSHSSLTFLS